MTKGSTQVWIHQRFYSIPLDEKENLMVKSVKKAAGDTKSLPSKHKQLRVLQKDASGHLRLAGCDTKLSSLKDVKTTPVTCNIQVHHDDEDEFTAAELTCNDEGKLSVAYWKELAKTRQISLTKALEENESLHAEVEQLKEENQRLKPAAEQATYLASVLESLVDSDDE